VKRLEPAGDHACTEHPPSSHRLGKAFDFNGAEIVELKQVSDEPARACRNHDLIGLGNGLQAGRQVRRLACDVVLRRPANPIDLADHRQPSCDPDANLSRTAVRKREACNRIDRRESSPDGTLGIVLMRLRVAEIRQGTIAHRAGNEPAEAHDAFADAAMKSAERLAHVLRVLPGRKRG
jgi:hypothetical protein